MLVLFWGLHAVFSYRTAVQDRVIMKLFKYLDIISCMKLTRDIRTHMSGQGLRMTKRWFLFVLSVALMPQAALPRSPCVTALQDYQVALKSYQDGLFDPAMAGFESYLQQCPAGEQALQAHYLLAELLYKRSDFTQALKHTQVVISHTPAVELRPQALLLGSQCALQLEQPDVAQTYLQQVVDSQATGEVRAAALYWLGEMTFQQQQPEEARHYYERVIQAHQSSSYALHAYYALGWLARQQGEVAAALEAFTTFLQRAPKHELALQARFARADLLHETGRLQEAATAFEQLAHEAPAGRQNEALFWWAETVYQLGQYDQAWTVYQRLLTEHPQSTRVVESLYGSGWTAVQQQRCEAAVLPWETLLQREPTFARVSEVRYQLGLCYIRLEQYLAARVHLQRLLAAETDTPQSQDAVRKLAALAFREQDYTEAIQYYTRALASTKPPEVFRLSYLLGESYAALDEQTQAIKHWQRVLDGPQTLPFYAQTLYRLGRLHVSQRSWPQAIAVLRPLWQDFPQFPERPLVGLALAQAYSNSQQCLEALPLYETTIEIANQGADRQTAFRAKVACLYALKRHAEVVETVSPLLKLEDVEALEPSLLYTLGQAHMQLQQFDAALEPFSLLQQRFPDSPLVIAMAPYFAFALEKAARGEEALAVWQAYLQHGTISDDAERNRLQLHVGRLAVQAKRWDEALALLAPARGAVSPTIAAEALFLSGEVYLQQRRGELALQVYQELLDRYRVEAQWMALARLRLGTLYEKQQEWAQALHAYQVLLETATDPAVIASARRRITAIEAGRVKPQPVPAVPSEG